MTRTVHSPLSPRQAGALALTAVTALTLLPGPSASAASGSGGKAKNVILLIGDGTGRTHVTAGRERFYGAAGRLTMEKAPAVGQASTYASEKDSNQPELVTDSASSATAWSSGVKTYDPALGVDAYGRRVGTLMEQAKQAGMRTGNVSTAEITDATPAGTMSHALLRGCRGPVYSDAACVPAGDERPQDATLITPIAEQTARNGSARSFAPATVRTPDDGPGVTDGSLEASLWLSYLSGHHTGAGVPLYATGPRSAQFSSYDNTDLYRKLFGALRALSGSAPNAPLPAPAG